MRGQLLMQLAQLKDGIDLLLELLLPQSQILPYCLDSRCCIADDARDSIR